MRAIKRRQIVSLIIGILWIMQNIVPFTVLCILVAGALGAGITWLRCKIREVRN